MTDPIISIDRQSKSWAVFDSFNCLTDFTSYTDENKAIELGKIVLKQKGITAEPRIVYPFLKSIKMYSSKKGHAARAK